MASLDSILVSLFKEFVLILLVVSWWSNSPGWSITRLERLPSIRIYPVGSVGPTRVHLTPSIGYEFLQCISNTTARGKTLPIEVIPVANYYDNNRSQYLGGGLTGPVVVSSIEAMQSIIYSRRLSKVIN